MTAAPATPSRQTLRDCVLLLLLAMGPALLAGWLHPKSPAISWSKPGVAEVSLTEVVGWPDPVLWVDARTSESYQIQHVPGAVLLNEESWERLFPAFLDVWQPNAKIVVYCDAQACNSSQAVALRLQRDLNQKEIYVLKGGWALWLETHP